MAKPALKSLFHMLGISARSRTVLFGTLSCQVMLSMRKGNQKDGEGHLAKLTQLTNEVNSRVVSVEAKRSGFA